MKIFVIFLFCILNYLIGSIPNGLIIGKLVKKVDIRKVGSHSIGATNTSRALGKKWGVVVGILDLFKSAGFLIVLRILSEAYKIPFFISVSYVNEFGLDIPFYTVYALFAIYGHVFSCFLRCSGGKAVATSIGAIYAISPLIAFFCTIIFITVTFTTGYVSLASLLGTYSALLLSVVLFIFFKDANTLTPTYLSAPYSISIKENIIKFSYHFICIIMIVIIIFIKHKENIKRLLKANENSILKHR